jgi:HK97 family phage prohead protease
VKTKTYEVVISKADTLPDELKADGEKCDFWGYASVEGMDRDGDIVRVKGISLKNHGNGRMVPLLAGHLRVLADGTSPVIGKIKQFKHIAHKDTKEPALAFAAEFVSTPLGKHYKTLHDDGALPAISIGFRPTKAEPLKDGGYDYLESELLEVSVVTIGANADAAVLRSLEDEHQKSAVNTVLNTIAKELTELTKHLNARLDDLEDAIVGCSKDAESSTGQVTPPPTKSQDDLLPLLKSIEQATAALRASRK